MLFIVCLSEYNDDDDKFHYEGRNSRSVYTHMEQQQHHQQQQQQQQQRTRCLRFIRRLNSTRATCQFLPEFASFSSLASIHLFTKCMTAASRRSFADVQLQVFAAKDASL
jgi:hypothetical protein